MNPSDSTRIRPVLLQSRSCLVPEGGPRQGHRRLHRGHSTRSDRWSIAVRSPRRHTTCAAGPGKRRGRLMRRSPTSTRPSGSTPRTPPPTTTAGSPGATSRSTTRPSPTTPRPSGSTRARLRLQQSRRCLGRPRRNTTRPSPTSPRPSGSIPKYADAYTNRGRAWEEKAGVRQGHRRLQRGHPARSEDGGGVSRARSYPGSTASEYDKAIADFSEAIRLDPQVPEVVLLPGDSPVIRRATTTRPIADFDQAIRLDPKNAEFYSRRGIALFYKPDYDKAIADFDQGDPACDPLRIMKRSPSIRGWAWGKKKEYDKAIRRFRRGRPPRTEEPDRL